MSPTKNQTPAPQSVKSLLKRSVNHVFEIHVTLQCLLAECNFTELLIYTNGLPTLRLKFHTLLSYTNFGNAHNFTILMTEQSSLKEYKWNWKVTPKGIQLKLSSHFQRNTNEIIENNNWNHSSVQLPHCIQ
jgi:hypothetical protein